MATQSRQTKKDKLRRSLIIGAARLFVRSSYYLKNSNKIQNQVKRRIDKRVKQAMVAGNKLMKDIKDDLQEGMVIAKNELVEPVQSKNAKQLKAVSVEVKKTPKKTSKK